MANKNGKSRKVATAVPGNDKGSFFSLSGKGRKARHANASKGGQSAGASEQIPE
jgi:hypothetical protein